MCFRFSDESSIAKNIENHLQFNFYPFYYITTFNKWETED